MALESGFRCFELGQVRSEIFGSAVRFQNMHSSSIWVNGSREWGNISFGENAFLIPVSDFFVIHSLIQLFAECNLMDGIIDSANPVGRFRYTHIVTLHGLRPLNYRWEYRTGALIVDIQM